MLSQLNQNDQRKLPRSQSAVQCQRFLSSLYTSKCDVKKHGAIYLLGWVMGRVRGRMDPLVLMSARIIALTFQEILF